RAHAELVAVEGLLGGYTVPAAAPGGLADRIIRRTRRASRRSAAFRVAAWVGSGAAAAAILLAAFIVWDRSTKAPRPGPPVVVRTMEKELETSQVYSDVPLGDRAKLEEVVVDHYNIGIVRSFLRDYDVVEEFETLEAIDRLESEGT
ncbi:MAG: hypothetical protein WBF17_00145, partial [Phycisphaerae bacterium]